MTPFSPNEASQRLISLAQTMLAPYNQPTLEGVMILAWRDAVIGQWRRRLDLLDPVARRVADICIAMAEDEHGNAWEIVCTQPMPLLHSTSLRFKGGCAVAPVGGLLQAEPVWATYRQQVEERLGVGDHNPDAFETARRKVDLTTANA